MDFIDVISSDAQTVWTSHWNRNSCTSCCVT